MRGEKERGKAGGVKGDLGTETAVDEPLNTSLPASVSGREQRIVFDVMLSLAANRVVQG